MRDKNNIPFYNGDLIKIERKDGTIEYNLIGEVRVTNFATFYRFLSLKLDGSFVDVQDTNQLFDNIEIIQGYGDEKVPDFRVRNI